MGFTTFSSSSKVFNTSRLCISPAISRIHQVSVAGKNFCYLFSLYLLIVVVLGRNGAFGFFSNVK
ncbi:hypothetical protein FCULG_00011222 [Fusarium culmorum]|uniref:Uncharacterized protein n=1 Tax=Fusarium culmorum TaxID=5516 RepID=A0A2T4H5G8_FUSCU|nr:hypothetical protein FCULG_00011222 [Fusarium culmorum]